MRTSCRLSSIRKFPFEFSHFVQSYAHKAADSARSLLTCICIVISRHSCLQDVRSRRFARLRRRLHHLPKIRPSEELQLHSKSWNTIKTSKWNKKETEKTPKLMKRQSQNQPTIISKIFQGLKIWWKN